MQPERFVTCGLVLRETDTRDADKILTVLTPDRGEAGGHRPGRPAQGQPRGRSLPAAGVFRDDPV